MDFFDLAIAAPSMTAALKTWGAGANLFHQGFARETDDPEIVAATTAKPGVVLQRPVGTNKPFREHADLPSDLNLGHPVKRYETKRRKAGTGISEKAAQSAALAYEKQRRKRERDDEKREGAQAKERERHEKAREKAQSALEAAQREHDARIRALESERAALKQRSQDEEARWKIAREQFEAAVRRARS